MLITKAQKLRGAQKFEKSLQRFLYVRDLLKEVDSFISDLQTWKKERISKLKEMEKSDSVVIKKTKGEMKNEMKKEKADLKELEKAIEGVQPTSRRLPPTLIIRRIHSPSKSH